MRRLILDLRRLIQFVNTWCEPVCYGEAPLPKRRQEQLIAGLALLKGVAAANAVVNVSNRTCFNGLFLHLALQLALYLA